MKAQVLQRRWCESYRLLLLGTYNLLRNLTTPCSALSWLTPFEWYCLKIVIWLILPVVICLSQRLSHACLSINVIQWNCEWLIKTVIVYLIMESYMDNRSNSRANTCCQTWLHGKVVFIRYKPIPSGVVMIHNNWANRGRTSIDRSSFCPISFRW